MGKFDHITNPGLSWSDPSLLGPMAPVYDFLVDVEMMVRNEVQYVRTGKHVGVPMRNCVDQWEGLANDARHLLTMLAKQAEG